MPARLKRVYHCAQALSKAPWQTLQCGLQGLFDFRFSLVYTSVDEVLPKAQELWAVAQQGDTKEARKQAQQQLNNIIQVGWLAVTR